MKILEDTKINGVCKCVFCSIRILFDREEDVVAVWKVDDDYEDE